MCARRLPVQICSCVSICDGKNWKAFLASISSEEKALQMIIENAVRREPCDETFSDGKQKREVMQALAGNAKMCHRSKQTLPGVRSTTKRAAWGCLFEYLGYGKQLSRCSPG